MSWIIGLVAFLVFGVWMGVWLRFKQLQLLQDIREAVTDYVYDDTEDDTEDESSGLEVTDDAVWVAARVYNEHPLASHPAAMNAALTAALAHLQGAEDDDGAVPEEVTAPPSTNDTEHVEYVTCGTPWCALTPGHRGLHSPVREPAATEAPTPPPSSPLALHRERLIEVLRPLLHAQADYIEQSANEYREERAWRTGRSAREKGRNKRIGHEVAGQISVARHMRNHVDRFVGELADAVLATAVDPDSDDVIARIRLAISDPGAFVKRDRESHESVSHWSTRAVRKALWDLAGGER